MKLYAIIGLMLVIINDGSSISQLKLNMVTRKEWKARKPTETLDISLPVPIVIIHHSYTPPACYTLEECKHAMRTMQDMHMDKNGWADIGYNFAVGSDGRIYEGRGWTKVGAQALGYNNISIGICLIGDWTEKLPPTEQLKSTQAIIEYGLIYDNISSEYILIGHREVRLTECPGGALFSEIQTWPHYTAHVHEPSYYYNKTKLNK